jgi:hypothetical protein
MNMMFMGGPEQVLLCNPDDRCLEMRMKAVSINHGLRFPARGLQEYDQVA